MGKNPFRKRPVLTEAEKMRRAELLHGGSDKMV
jgi:hypothetical protein